MCGGGRGTGTGFRGFGSLLVVGACAAVYLAFVDAERIPCDDDSLQDDAVGIGSKQGARSDQSALRIERHCWRRGKDGRSVGGETGVSAGLEEALQFVLIGIGVHLSMHLL